MKFKKLKINFKDKRGSISDIFYNTNIQHVAIIKSKPHALRGDHFHKKTTQIYVWPPALQFNVPYYEKVIGMTPKLVPRGSQNPPKSNSNLRLALCTRI